MATGTIKKPMHIECGEITSGTISASGETTVSANFNESYATAPVVVASVAPYTSNADRRIYISKIEATTTGVSIAIQNPYSSSWSLTTNRKITWVAIG